MPVILAMMRLEDGLGRSRQVVSSHEVEGDGIKCETDLFAIERHFNGRLAVAVGECKDGCEITDADVEHLAAVSDAFYASGIECYLVFAKLGNGFLPIELDRFRAHRDRVAAQRSHDDDELAWSPRPSPILLGPPELEYFEVYEHRDLATLRVPHGRTLRDLAANSEALYLDPPRAPAAAST